MRFSEGRTHASRPCFEFGIGIVDSAPIGSGRSKGVEGRDEDEEMGDVEGESEDEDIESSLSDDDRLALTPSRRSTKYPNRSPYVGPKSEARNAPLECDFTETTTSCPFWRADWISHVALKPVAPLM